MDIFFCCTSMAHLFTAAYITEKYYKDSSRKHLILLSQMKEMLTLIPNILQSGVWNDVKVIDNEAREIFFIQEQVSGILKGGKNKFFLFGFENVSFSIAHMTPQDDMIAYVDDGGMTYNFREGLKKNYCKELFAGKEFPLEKIKELWLTEPKMIVDDFGAACKKMQIAEDLQNKMFREEFLSKLQTIFDFHDTGKIDYDIIFFDTYLASIDWISIEFEEFMLQEMVKIAGSSQIAMKAHPNEKYWKKYSNLNLTLMENSIVPWEVSVLLQNSVTSGPRIYMTNVSSVVLKQRLVLGDKESYIIFLYHIYEKYCPSLKEKLETASIDRYMEVLEDKRMFFPKTFEELAVILKRIGIKVPDRYTPQEHVEKFLIIRYWDLWKKTRSNVNFTTIYYRGQEVKLPIMLNDKALKLSLVFDLAKKENTTFKTEGDELFWHVLRGVAVKTRIDRIVYEDTAGQDREVSDDEMSRLGARDENGYLVQYNLDAVYKFPSIDPVVTKIRIDAEIIVLDTYEEMSNVFRERMRMDGECREGLLKELAEERRLVGKLSEDIEDRDKIRKQLMQDIENRDRINEQLMRDIVDRDNAQKQLTKAINDRDEVLNRLMEDISHRDLLIGQLQGEKREVGKHLSELEGKNAELEGMVSDFRDSFWGKMYYKRRR